MTQKTQIFTYEAALLKSTEYFNGNELAACVFLDKYALKNTKGEILEDSPEMTHRRIAKEFARIEKKKFKNPLSEEYIFSLLDRFKYIVPQGSPMFGIGNDFQTVSLSNCFLTDCPVDSYGGILKVDEQLVQISKRRGGCGTDISDLRPEGSPTKNAALSSTGTISWMKRYSNSIREVGQEGRRGALMISYSVHGMDIIPFSTIKNDNKQVTGANISVRLTDEFLRAVDADQDYEQRFPVERGNKKLKLSRNVRARDVWDTIINSAHLRAEPGLLFWDRITNYNAVDCYSVHGFKTRGTNPCGEVPLCPKDSCRLLLLNFFSYIANPFTKDAYFDFELFKTHAKVGQRLMDDMVDLEIEKIDKIISKVKNDPEDESIKRAELELWEGVKEIALKGRRTGLGGTGIGDMLAAANVKYGSEESIEFVENVQRQFKFASYESSVDMAEEIGPFPIWNWETEKDSEFLLHIKAENPDLYNRISKFGRRNIANLTFAPAGSMSILTETSSGGDPLFDQVPYIRRKKVNPSDKNARVDFTDQSGDCFQEFEIYHPKIKMWMEITGESDLKKSPWAGACAEEIDWINRVRMQAAMQRHIDHSISTTINLPENVSKETVAKIYEEAWKQGCKGITVYRKNCRSGILIDKPTKEEKCAFTKRPKELECDVYHCKVKTDEYFCIVGLDACGNPYEVFAGKNGVVSKNIEKGTIYRQKKGHYQLYSNNVLVLDNITGFLSDDGEALTRMTSMSLRNTPSSSLHYIVEQLAKVQGDFTNLSRAIARCLKKYIPDGTSEGKCEEVRDGKVCGGEVVRENGCKICKTCGFSHCN